VDSNRSESRPEPFHLDALQVGKLIFVVHTWAGTRSPPRNKSLEFLATLGDYLSKTVAGQILKTVNLPGFVSQTAPYRAEPPASHRAPRA
jgi:hypothetical protein